MILVFSGTGNSRYVAGRIADLTGDAVLDLNGRLRAPDEPLSLTDSRLVVVSPTYAWRLPRVVEEALRKARCPETVRVWFVMTCGDDIGSAEHYNRKLCADRGFAYMGTAPVAMPENYLAMFDVPDQREAAEIIRRAGPAIDRAAGRIAGKEAFPSLRTGAADRLKSGLVNPAFYALFVRADAFRTTDACIGCGRCEEICPLGNIRLTDGRPSWGKRCTHCMACICHCPKEAIEYGRKSVGKPRYRCVP
ncbi:MAG: EFR1 family ferrodoxin [Clostridia bacterium]|nr:EFR1 family ferrodoxin [Clostridia bacterium]